MPSLPRRLFDSLASVLRKRASRREPLLLEIDDIRAYRRPDASRDRVAPAEEAPGLAPCRA